MLRRTTDYAACAALPWVLPLQPLLAAATAGDAAAGSRLPRLFLGRAAGNDLILDIPGNPGSVSRQHALVTLRGGRYYELTDLHSTNGTWVRRLLRRRRWRNPGRALAAAAAAAAAGRSAASICK